MCNSQDQIKGVYKKISGCFMARLVVYFLLRGQFISFAEITLILEATVTLGVCSLAGAATSWFILKDRLERLLLEQTLEEAENDRDDFIGVVKSYPASTMIAQSSGVNFTESLS